MDTERKKLSLKPIFIAGGAVVSLFALGLILKTIGSMTFGEPSSMGEATTITLKQATIAPPAAEPNLPESAQVLRNSAWNEVQAKCGTQLKQAFGEFDEQLEIARAQLWLLKARGESQKTNGKKSEYEWLVNNAYLGFAAEIQQLTKSGQMGTDGRTIKAYRDRRGALLDIAEAVSNTGSPLTPNVPTLSLNRAIDSCYQAASDYNALRENAAESARNSSPEPKTKTAEPTQTQTEQTEQTDGEEAQ
ncbi:hypothetical protein H6S82_01050 [Planktothrix sp. FACHB-1355]|uniref:Uncharacterized protein n=1 Tax=Aerosakkonema funiforme FACHB-1375 TaxID=2949571 RepID=A0A926ZIT1_9CYAN|nr:MULTISPECIES: hypothetical protein [Oscillatoriales]MBD2184808.1 hypothetical protein [Aerosakkonema funiforme FACHB-1375]MBD3557456.1 hypothetical protein [Planktothrix sp. FACHB-1355]